jgi:hypothetical protein
MVCHEQPLCSRSDTGRMEGVRVPDACSETACSAAEEGKWMRGSTVLQKFAGHGDCLGKGSSEAGLAGGVTTVFQKVRHSD